LGWRGAAFKGSTVRKLVVLLAAAGFMVLAAGTQGDEIVLHDGEVIEGKIDTAATNAANKGKTNPEELVYVVVVDESGKTQTVPQKEIAYMGWGKAPWEKVREAKDWYEKNASKVKDTKAHQENFGRQCQGRGLGDEAKKHFMRALEMTRAEMEAQKKTSIKDRERLMLWCRKAGLIEEEKKELDAIVGLMWKEAETGKDPAAEFVKVADWTRSKGMADRALELYEEILAKFPGNAGAEAGVKAIKAAPEVANASLLAEFAAKDRAWKIKVCIEDNADAATMKEWEEKLKLTSDFIWILTEGQFFVAEWTLEDQSSTGQIIVEKGKLGWGGRNGPSSSGVLATCYRVGMPNWEVRCPGKVWANVLCHEMFHGVFGLRDEYMQRPMCNCVMRSAPAPLKICRPGGHTGGGRQQEPCSDSIKKRVSDVSFPNPGWTTVKEDAPGGRDRGTSTETEGYLKRGDSQISKAPVCKVIVIDK
jgi:hypothetical protein